MKRDIKYIIKRILIGTGIAVLLFNLKQCNVYAETVNRRINVSYQLNRFSFDSSSCSSNNSSKNFVYNNQNFTPCYSDLSRFPYIYFYSSTLNEYYMVYINWSLNSNDSLEVYFNNNDSYLLKNNNDRLPIHDSLNDTSGYFNYYFSTSLQSINSSISFMNNSSNNLNGSNLNYSYISSSFDNINYYLSADTRAYTPNLATLYENFLVPNGFSIIDIDSRISKLSINNQEISISISSNYSKVDLTGYQAILLVPENYPYLASEYGYIDSNNDEMIHYTFGYENCVRPILVDITNLDKWYSNSQWNQGFLSSDPAENSPNNPNNNYCSSSAELMSLDYPIQTNNEYNYMGLLIYNNSVDYSNDDSNNWINNQHNPYGTSYVYVNEDYYDYYLISDYDSFNQTLDFTDFNQENTTLFISSLPTFDDLVSSSISDTEFDDISGTKQRINKILGFVKLPINFFSRLPDLQCEPLSAPFPHGNFNIELPCLSSSFENFMGSTLFNIVRLIINGLLSYRVISGLVVFTYSRLDPKDMRLDVGAL